MRLLSTRQYAIAGLVVLCLALVLLLPHHASANVFASNLKASAKAFAPGLGQTITFSFILNENADNGVVLKIYRASDNQLIRTVNLGALAKGTQTYVWDGKDDGGVTVPLGQTYYFTVTASDDGHTWWTQLSVDGGWTKYYHSKGLDVNKNPNSRYYGRIYVLETIGSLTDTAWTGYPRVTQDGVYILNADCTDAGFGDAARTGGVTWPVTGGTYSPRGVFVGPDDLVYVCDQSDVHAGLWVGDPDFAVAQPILDPTGASSIGLTENHGSVSMVMTEGIGPDRIVYTMDEDYDGGTPIAIGSIWQYNVGNTGLPWTKAPDAKIYSDSLVDRIINYYNDFARDSQGNWYISQERSDGRDVASFIKVGPTKSNLLFNSYTQYGGQDPLRSTRGIALDEPRSRLAFATYNAGRLIILDTSMDIEKMEVIVPVSLMAVGDGGVILVSNDRGATWSQPASGTAQNLNDIGLAVAGGNVIGYAVGAGGTIVKTANSGASWTVLTTPGTADLYGVKAVSSSTVYAVGAGGAVYKTTDSGANWTAQTTGVTADLKSIDVSLTPTTVLWTCGTNGTILKTTDGGTTWSQKASGTTANLNSISLARGTYTVDHGWAVGDNGTILRTTDDGETWSPQVVSGLTSNLVSVQAVTAKIAKIVASDGSIIRTLDGGSTWTVTASGAGFLGGGRFMDPAVGWAVGIGGTALATKDGGANWQVLSTGVSAKLNRASCIESYEPGWTIRSTWRDVAFDAVGNLYAVDNNLEVLRVYSPPDGPNSSTTRSFDVVTVTSGDVTAPSTPVVADEGDSTFDSTRLGASWSGAADPESGVTEYAYAVSGVPTDLGHSYVVGWTSTGSATSANITGLNLKNGTYYILVKAKNGAGIWSDVGVSDGITVYVGMSIGAAKNKTAGSVVALTNVVVTGKMTDFNYIMDPVLDRLFFVEEQGRSAGILVDTSLPVPEPGSVVHIVGTVQKGDRGINRPYPTDNVAYIAATDIIPAGSTVDIAPLHIGTRYLGGSAFGIQPGATTGGIGLNTTALKARVFGMVTGSGYGAYGGQFIYVDDGSNVLSDMPGIYGVKCYISQGLASSLPVPNPGEFVTVTGIADLEYLDPSPGTPGDESMVRIIWASDMF